MNPTKTKIRLGALLVQQGIISEEQLMQVLTIQKQSGRKLGHELIAQGFVSENQLLNFLSQHLNVPLVDIPQYNVLAQAVTAGARLVKPGQKTFWGGYAGYFSDPDGHLWEVAHNPFFWIGPED